MRNTNIRRAGLVSALLVAGSGLAGAPAQADTPAGVADLGEASFTKGSTTVTVPTLAPCAVEGPTSASAGSLSKTGLSWGGGTSSCTTTVVDPDNDTTSTKSTATGKNFELSALVSAGGPRIRLSSYTVTCDAVQKQTSANWTFSGLAGITGLPSPMPAGYTKPITKSNGTVLANAVFNTQTLPGNGSISLTMLRIDFLPASGITGSVTVGRTACSPTP